jgi:hypothetical protein
MAWAQPKHPAVERLEGSTANGERGIHHQLEARPPLCTPALRSIHSLKLTNGSGSRHPSKVPGRVRRAPTVEEDLSYHLRVCELLRHAPTCDSCTRNCSWSGRTTNYEHRLFHAFASTSTAISPNWQSVIGIQM